MAVAAAEPQWVHPYAVHNAAHLKTPSGDTVSVQAAKIHHHQLKAAEYAKKAYVPYAFHNGVVAAPVSSAVYSYPATYAAATVPYTHGVYSGHYIGKREAEAEAEPQYYANTYAGVSPYYNNVYNTPYTTQGIYGGYTGLTHNVYNTGVYGAGVYNTGLTGYTTPYSTYGVHHLGKRDADSQYYNTAYAGVHPYYNNVYNTARVYGGYTGYPYTTYGNVWNRFHY